MAGGKSKKKEELLAPIKKEFKKPFLWIEVNKPSSLGNVNTYLDFVEQIFEKMAGCTIFGKSVWKFVGLKVADDMVEDVEKTGLPLLVETNLINAKTILEKQFVTLVSIKDWIENPLKTRKIIGDLSSVTAPVFASEHVSIKTQAMVIQQLGFDFILIPGKVLFDCRAIHLKKIATNVVPSWYFDEEKHTQGVTPARAIEDGADMLVVGDWITKNIDPTRVLKNTLQDMFGKEFKRG